MYAGERTRDELCFPIDITNANHSGLSYLQKAIEIFEDWRESKRAGLTPETFLACLQIIKSIPKLADHLQKKHRFSYLLPGKLISDPIEGCFGWYKQVHGGNFFMSVKQLFLAEKNLLLKLAARTSVEICFWFIPASCFILFRK